MVNAVGEIRTYGVAMAVLASCVSAAAWGAAAALSVAAPAPPTPGKLESYKDWAVGCDNGGRCEAIALSPEEGAVPGDQILLEISREAGPLADVEIRAEHGDRLGHATLAFVVDGREIATAQSDGTQATVRGAQAMALARTMARGNVLEVRSGKRITGRPSLAGSAAALRYMDALQGRAGTATALVAAGPLRSSAVRAAPVLPVVKRVAVPAKLKPVAFWREELTRVGKLTGCTDEMREGPLPELYALSKSETLAIIPCGAGAYNFTSVPVIATGIAGRRTFRLASFDFQPGWSEDKAHPMLVNASWTADKARLESYAKGRGLGDCGGSEAYVWDGSRFRLIEATAMDECRGSWEWIRTWQARVEEE